MVASYGHVADLPSKGLNVNIRKDFEPTYEIDADKKKVVSDIVKKAKSSDVVYLMSQIPLFVLL